VTTTPSPAGPLDTAAAAAFWHRYAVAHPHTVGPGDEYGVRRLGESREQADEMLGRVRHGAVRATADLAGDLAHRGEALPRIGARRVVCDGRGVPALVLRTVELRLATFREVDSDFALDAGHGDLRSWREQHRAGWERSSAARDAVWSESDEIVLERFRVVWPDELAD
jgi:uncharacterized protein YhfF